MNSNLLFATILVFAISLHSTEAAASKCWAYTELGPNGENLSEQMECEAEDDACFVSSCAGVEYRDCFNTKEDSCATWKEDCQRPFGKRMLRDNRCEVCTGEYCNTAAVLPKVEPLTCLASNGKSAECGLDAFGCYRWTCNEQVNAGCYNQEFSCEAHKTKCAEQGYASSFSCDQCDTNDCNKGDEPEPDVNTGSKCWGFTGIGPNGENLAEKMQCATGDDACFVSSCNGVEYRDCFNTKEDSCATWKEDCQKPFGEKKMRDNRCEVCTGEYCNDATVLPQVKPLTCLTGNGSSVACGLDAFGCYLWECNGEVNAGCYDKDFSCAMTHLKKCVSEVGESYSFTCNECTTNNCNRANKSSNGSARNGGIGWIVLFGIFILIVSV